MLPLLIECSRCLEDGIVKTPVEVDIALVYGLGFPPFRGGPFRYADAVGLATLIEAAEQYGSLGKLYEPTTQMVRLAKEGGRFHRAGAGSSPAGNGDGAGNRGEAAETGELAGTVKEER